MTTELIADCECCGRPLHEGDDYDFIAEGLVWVCRPCVEAEEDRLREEFGWIGVWRGEFADEGGSPHCLRRPSPELSTPVGSGVSSPTQTRATTGTMTRRSDTGGAGVDCKGWTSTMTRTRRRDTDAYPSRPADPAPSPPLQGTTDPTMPANDPLTSDTGGRDAENSPRPSTGASDMAFTAETGDHKVSRGDIFLVDPRALVVDWTKNLSRNGEEPPVDEALVELARDMMPKKGQGDSEDGSSGQLNPILTRPLPNRRLEVIGGFRRMRAALWLIESGTCPDFKLKYTVSRLSDAEAALVNLSENLQREDPRPVQLAHAIRSLTEDYGLTMKQVAGRLKRSESWCSNLLKLVMLPTAIQASVASGETPVSVALELVKLPGDQQIRVFESLNGDGEKITAARVRQKRQEAHEVTGEGGPVPRTLKQVRSFLESRTGPADLGHRLAARLLDYIAGKRSEEAMEKDWDRAFAEHADARRTG